MPAARILSLSLLCALCALAFGAAEPKLEDLGAAGPAKPEPLERVASIGPVIPKIKAGEVQWHESFDRAVAAAKKSGKPVFLFQLVGNLDESLC